VDETAPATNGASRGALLPETGDDVDVLAAHSRRLRGQIRADGPGTLTIELEERPLRLPFRFPSGSAVEVEWIDPCGPVQLAARVTSSHRVPVPTLEVAIAGAPERVELRTSERSPVALEASAWSLMQPTRSIPGTTVNLGAGGALLRLPGLSPFTTSIQLQIGLPGRPLSTTARIVRRQEPDLVGVTFETITPTEWARLADFVRESSRHLERQAD
jgi:hypothetical protein